MSFDWRKYLELAETLSVDDDEARKRSAVSRAYYSAFCTARDWLAANDRRFSMPPPGETHKVVWDTFERGPESAKVWIAKEGRKLRLSRNTADYDAQVSGLNQTVELSIKRAKQLLERLSKLHSGGGLESGPTRR